MNQNIDFSKVPVFLAAAECLNFTEAADRLFMTQSSLSKSIASFEADIGFPLFERGNRRVSLTPEGAYLYQELGDIMDRVNDVIDTARQIRAGHTGILRIGTSGYLAKTPIFEKMGFHFSMAYPSYEIELHHMPYPELRRSLIDDRVDIILYNQHDLAMLHDVYMLTIARGSTVLLCNPHNITDNPDRQLSIDDFRDRKFISLNQIQFPSYNKSLYSCCNAYGFTPRISRYASSMIEMLNYINSTNYVTILDRVLIPEDAAGCGIVPVPYIDGMERLDTVLAWKKDNRYAPLQSFTDLAEEFVCAKAIEL